VVQSIELCGWLPIALSSAIIDSSDLPDKPKSIPLLVQAVEFCGFILIALS